MVKSTSRHLFYYRELQQNNTESTVITLILNNNNIKLYILINTAYKLKENLSEH